MAQRTWAPWRIKYVTGKRKPGCVFCRREARHVIESSKHSYVILNIFPYNPGHVMVVPKRHIRNLNQLRGGEWSDVFQMVERARFILERSFDRTFNMTLDTTFTVGSTKFVTNSTCSML